MYILSLFFVVLSLLPYSSHLPAIEELLLSPYFSFLSLEYFDRKHVYVLNYLRFHFFFYPYLDFCDES